MKTGLLIGLWLLLVPSLMRGQDVKITASVDPEVLGVQDQLSLTVTASGKDSDDVETPRIGSIRNFKVVSGPNISSQFQWINGSASSRKSFTYILIPEKEGQFTIGPIEVKAGNKIHRTQPLHVRVTSAPKSATPPGQTPDQEDPSVGTTAADFVFVRAEPDRRAAYPGQQVTLSYNIYTRVPITGVQLHENPPLTGFWVEDLDVDHHPRGTATIVNGREYRIFTVKKQALFATAEGRLTIPSSTFAISARTAANVFDLFDRTETVYRRNPAVVLEVQRLPSQGRPSGFTNAVGSFRLTAKADKNRVAAGEAVALQVKLEGRGNLKMIPDVALPSSPNLMVYSSKRSDNIGPSPADQIGGSKVWEYVIVPKAPGQQTIPALSFSFFNAEAERFETVTTSPVSLTVYEGNQAAGESALSGEKQDLVRKGADISFIKLSTGVLKEGDQRFYRSGWFLLLGALPLAFNAAAFLLLRRRSPVSGTAGEMRSRRAGRTALKRLSAAEKAGHSDARLFYDEAAAALSGYLIDRFNLTEIELTEDRLQPALARNDIGNDVIDEIRECLRECDFGRFVSAAQSAGRRRELSGRIRKSIESIENEGGTARL